MELDGNAEFCLRVAEEYIEAPGQIYPSTAEGICRLLLAFRDENALLRRDVRNETVAKVDYMAAEYPIRAAAAGLLRTLSLSHSARYAYGESSAVYVAAIALGAALNLEHLCTADCLPDAHIATNWNGSNAC